MARKSKMEEVAPQVEPQVEPRVVEQLAQHRNAVEAWVEERGWEKDEGRIDFNAARRLVRDGVSVDRVQAALAELPSIQEREADPAAYGHAVGRRAGDTERLASYSRAETRYAERQGWDPKPHVAEFSATKRLIAEGASVGEASEALAEVSRGRGPEHEAYARRTAERALERLQQAPEPAKDALETTKAPDDGALKAKRGRGPSTTQDEVDGR